MSFLVGKIVLDIDAGAPNNGRGADNIGQVKALKVGRDTYPYVSAQAFRRWLRDTMAAGEPSSPVTRSGNGAKQQAYSAGRPDQFLDDDLFGYMVAVKGGGSTQRDTVLATGTLVSVTPQRPVADFGTMSRGFPAGANPVIHEHEHYTADVAGDLLLDLPRVGVFETDGSGLKVNLVGAALKEATDSGAEATSFRGNTALRLSIVERRRRTAVVLRALASLRGGAKQSLHYGDRTPALVLLAPLKGGVNPFTRVLTARDGRTYFSTSILREELEAWADEIDGPVLIGWAPGFLGDQRANATEDLADVIAAGRVSIAHPRVMLTSLAERIGSGQHDDWFEDPTR
jgi:CRISPR-associated protein Cas7/Cst2/DevR subtype I-B